MYRYIVRTQSTTADGRAHPAVILDVPAESAEVAEQLTIARLIAAGERDVTVTRRPVRADLPLGHPQRFV